MATEGGSQKLSVAWSDMNNTVVVSCMQKDIHQNHAGYCSGLFWQLLPNEAQTNPEDPIRALAGAGAFASLFGVGKGCSRGTVTEGLLVRFLEA